jgi:glycosyltransferase involved in cell wall biosynthesis
MKIALCLEYPIQQPGGTEVLVRELIHGLAEQHELVLVSDDAPAIIREPEFAGKIAAHFAWSSSLASLEKSKQLATDLKTAGIGLAHFHFGGNYSWGSRLFNRAPVIHLSRLGVPCVATNHGVFGLLEGYIGAQRSSLTKLSLLPAAWASRLQLIAHLKTEIAVSMNDYAALRRRYWPMRGKFQQVYHSRIHESDPVVARPRSRTILCAGTVGPRKGQPFLARAFAAVAADFPEWDLLFIGRSGDERTAAELGGIIESPEWRGRARWIRGCSDEELREWFQSVEIFAMPSLHEGLGLTLQEALYYGCACIASRIGGIPDLIQHGDNGILVPRANTNELANGLRQLMLDSALRERLRTRGRDSVLEKNMTSERMVARYEQIYRKVMDL